MEISLGDRVRIPVLEEGEPSNREYNVYEVAGINRFGWIWLSLDKFLVEAEEDTGLRQEWVDGGQYDGYNGDIVMRHTQGDFYEPCLMDDRCRLHFMKPGGFRLVKERAK